MDLLKINQYYTCIIRFFYLFSQQINLIIYFLLLLRSFYFAKNGRDLYIEKIRNYYIKKWVRHV